MKYTSALILGISLFMGGTAIGFAQNTTAQGTVTDAKTDNTLPGVNILVEGTSSGTSTDKNGHYELNVASLQDTLVFSFVGYKTRHIPINGRTQINIKMQSQAISGEEMVVVGYGEQKKVNLTGAVDAVDSDKLASRPATNVTSLLQGQMSGVTITQSSGQPGQEGTSIFIRGVGTMNNAQPLVIVDGIESTMDDINPRDIKSVSVLKDAAAAAIYGSRAANGVVLITTKRGKQGSPKISYNTYVGWQKATNLPDYVSSANYARLINEANKNEGTPPQYSEKEIKKFETGEEPYQYPNTDWLDLLLQGSGFTQNHNLSFAGGNDISSYRISLGYNEQYGLMKKTESNRYNLRANLDSKVTDWFDMGLNAALSRRDIVNPTTPYSGGTTGPRLILQEANRIPAVVPNKFKDGTWRSYIDGNPVAWVEEGGKATSQISNLRGSVFGEATLLEGLSLKGTAGLDYTSDYNKTHVKDITYGDGTFQGPNSVQVNLPRTSEITLKALLKYKNRYGKHGIKGLLGISQKDKLNRLTSAFRKEFPSNELSELTAGSTTGWTNDGTKIESKLGSYFTRINYDYDNKYLFEANLRRDGSSRFARDKRWGWFPSFSMGWRVSEEHFMEGISWLDDLKLRGSWGKLGNNRIANYQYIPIIALGQNYDFGGAIADGAAQITATNPDITWEVTTEWDAGIDAELFQNKLSVTADYYNRYTDDILTGVPVAAVYGLSAPTKNAGAMRNRGIEFKITHNNTIGSFQYNISLNGAYNKNVVEKYKHPSTGNRIRKEGVAWNSFYGYKWIGYFQTDQEASSSPHQTGIEVKAGDLKYKDQNGDGKVNGEDRVVLGNTIPEITFGFNIGARFKGFDFSIFFQGADRVYRTLFYQNQWPFVNGYTAQKMHMDRTIVRDGKIVKRGHFPRLEATSTANRPLSSFSVHDAAYIRLKNLQIGYTLPHAWTNSLNISKVRVYYSARNLLTITRDYPEGYDPETSSGRGGNIYPQVEFNTFGLDITF